MSGPADCRLLGRWRITNSDLWDAEYLDLVEPATVCFQTNGHGSFAFGALDVGMRLEYGRTIAFSISKASTKATTSAAPALPNSWKTARSKSS